MFIGACFIIGELGPSLPTTAPMVLVWVMKRKIPDMIYKRKSPLIAAPFRPSSENIKKNARTKIAACIIFSRIDMTALPWVLRTIRTIE